MKGKPQGGRVAGSAVWHCFVPEQGVRQQIKIRGRAAMAAQAQAEGRFLGRPTARLILQPGAGRSPWLDNASWFADASHSSWMRTADPPAVVPGPSRGAGLGGKRSSRRICASL